MNGVKVFRMPEEASSSTILKNDKYKIDSNFEESQTTSIQRAERVALFYWVQAANEVRRLEERLDILDNKRKRRGALR